MKKIIVSFLLVSLFSGSLFAEQTKSKIVLLGDQTGPMANLAVALRNSEIEEAKRDEILIEIEKDIKHLPLERIQELENYLSDEEWRLKHSRIMFDLVKAYKARGEWKAAVKYQKMQLFRAYRIGTITRELSDYWALLREFQIVTGKKIDLDNKLPLNQSELDFIKKCYSDGPENNSDYQLDLAQYYLKHLWFSEAAEHARKGLEIEKQRTDSKFKAEIEIHYFLRNLYVLKGDYEEALNENRWVLQNEPYSRKPDNRIYIDQSLRRAIQEKADPKRLRFLGNNSNDIEILYCEDSLEFNCTPFVRKNVI